MTKSTAIIDFMAGLHGMDRLQRVGITDQLPGAFDLLTGQAFEPATDFPDGEMLVLERFDGPKVLVHSYKVLDALILRSAKAWSITEGGSAEERYKHLKEHLAHKTGFDY